MITAKKRSKGIRILCYTAIGKPQQSHGPNIIQDPFPAMLNLNLVFNGINSIASSVKCPKGL